MNDASSRNKKILEQKRKRKNKVENKNSWTTFGRLISYLLPSFGYIVGIIFCIIGTTIGILYATRMIGLVIDKYILRFDFDSLWRSCALMMFIYLGTSVLTWLQNFWLLFLTQNTVADIRKEIFVKFQKLPVSYFDKTTLGELMSRVTNDVDNISTAISSSLTQIFQSIFTLVTTFMMMISLNTTLTITTILSIPFVMLVTRLITSKTKKLFITRQEKLGKLNGYIEEVVTGNKVVKTFSREKEVIEDFSEFNEELLKAGIPAEIYAGIMGPIMNAVTNLSYISVVAVGTYLILNKADGVTIGLISNFILYARQYTKPINELASQINILMSGVAGAERVFEVLDSEEELPNIQGAENVVEILEGVELKDVCFSYDKKTPVLENVNLKVKKGETIALVGSTGAGKSTIIQLLNRFYDVDSGAIEIDGRNINDLRRESVRSHIAVVLQDTYLFTGTIRENIRYGNLKADDYAVEQAAKLANAYGFILKLPGRLDFMLTNSGNNLSQGQRQMISIARAILANPSILILDEATSNVDTKTEKKIQDGMRNLMQGRTNFVIAHRLSTIRDADLIAVVEDGQIKEQGNHNELLEQKGFYYDMFNYQTKEYLV